MQAVKTLKELKRYGGYSFVERVIDDIRNISPEREARKKIFQTEGKLADKKMLAQRLATWIALLESDKTVEELQTEYEQKAQGENNLYRDNLAAAMEKSNPLEANYRAMSLFYKNTELDKVPNVTVLNASIEQLADLDNPLVFDAIAAEFKQKYDRLDLRENYSLLVMPGYLGKNSVLSKWAKMAHTNKVMLLTDFDNQESGEDTAELFATSNLTGGDLFRSNVIMTCNWLVGRGKTQIVVGKKNNALGVEVDDTQSVEAQDLFVPPSAALAGKIYYTTMSQVTAGKKHGMLNEVDATRYPLLKSELSTLERLGLVPMVSEYGQVMAFSGKTLFNGDNLGLKTYSVVRVFDYVVKVLFDFLNRRAFENWNSQIEADLRGQIVNFLDSIKGPNKLIEKFKIVRFERDDKIKDQIYLDIRLTPYFPAKSFVIRLDGRKGDDVENPAWASDYSEA
ncbi:type VI secretion system contractile sheath protein TssC [Hymenobacter sp. UV11]|nr:type VI secretion system contractile sheath protein TssC [Hymenobacter sp. UV11]